MKPAPFEYVAPDSLEETLSVLAEHGDEAKILAGGQSLVPMMNFRLAQPAMLVDCNRLSHLEFIRPGDDGGLKIGAMAGSVLPYPTRGEAGRRAAVSYFSGFASNPLVRRVIGLVSRFRP